MKTGKYDFELDLDSANSIATILQNISPNSSVLELGCAHGRMTKYLKEKLCCNVSIAEIDEVAGKVASQWANQFFIGSHDGDITRTGFFLELHCLGIKNLDYIIFADVLEHLINPKTVLKNAKHLLSPTGSIWISIPNISHNAVIIDLWNDKFEYRETGLLDNTHLRFFTIQSLSKMIDDCGLEAVNKINLKNIVKNTEFNNTYKDVPKDIAMLLKQREYGEVYQFVWELKVKS